MVSSLPGGIRGTQGSKLQGKPPIVCNLGTVSRDHKSTLIDGRTFDQTIIRMRPHGDIYETSQLECKKMPEHEFDLPKNVRACYCLQTGAARASFHRNDTSAWDGLRPPSSGVHCVQGAMELFEHAKTSSAGAPDQPEPPQVPRFVSLCTP